eukprot:TRINITY_DN5383_c0_g2_i17.p1 TRINITY_DN5383_c0_g2~~TRINITY_DN5383_c0_g2_i17.p1  ORF type:complete len:223 (-),score=43.61 TRINITY_DN5383_c0_g2_i17:522-1190(-)
MSEEERQQFIVQEKVKYQLFLNRTYFSGSTLDSKLAHMEQLTDDEFLKLIEERYSERTSSCSGGFLAMAGYFSMRNIHAKLPIPFFIPWFPLITVLLFTEYHYTCYSTVEIALCSSSSLFLSLIFFLATRKNSKLFVWNSQARVLSIVIFFIAFFPSCFHLLRFFFLYQTFPQRTAQKVTKNSAKIFGKTTENGKKVSEVALDRMKKRNEKFRASKKVDDLD